MGNGLLASKSPAEAVLTWDAVTCGSLQRYVIYGAPDFSTPFPAGWTELASGPTLEHAEPLDSAHVAFRVVTENGCGERSN